MLLRQGCDEIQGYLYSRPLPSRDMAQWLRRCDEGDGPGPQAPTQADLPATVG
jgi:predicted signal transduction protein with EAL and GGDEF domain